MHGYGYPNEESDRIDHESWLELQRIGRLKSNMEKLGTGFLPAGRWIRNQKHLYSEETGYDVGVPETVDRLISRARKLRRNPSLLESSQAYEMDKILLSDAQRGNIASREQWISMYLFDSFACEPLNLFGELHRFGSRIRGISEDEVRLDRELVEDYVEANKLSDELYWNALYRLGLQEVSAA